MCAPCRSRRRRSTRWGRVAGSAPPPPRPEPPAVGWRFDRLTPLAVRLSGANLSRETQRLVDGAGFSSVTASRLDRLGIVRLFAACDPRGPERHTAAPP